MSLKATRHEHGDPTFLGTPRHPPFVMFCRVPLNTRWCGRLWTANTVKQYESLTQDRDTHESLCSALAVAMPK